MIEGDPLDHSQPRRPAKSEAAFRTISEVSEDLEIPQHVLRFWESKFPQIKPLKRGGGRRYYRPEDVQLLRRIRDLLYKDGYTIRGVQKLLREQPRAAAAPVAEAEPPPAPAEVRDLLDFAPESAAEEDVAEEDGLHHLDRMLEELMALRDLLQKARKTAGND